MTRVLTINGGSSSVKFGIHDVADEVVEVSVGQSGSDEDLFTRIGDVQPDAIGHRIVHGGADLFTPVLIDASVLARLQRATAFAPLHGPASLALIAQAEARFPGVPQVACFDTGFHADLPEIAATLPLPKPLRDQGVRRYGFHGLSCESIIAQFGACLPERLIIAHLGSGASVTAVRSGRSVDTSMGMTPAGGVTMATRTGDIDPGVLLYLMREHGMDANALEDLIDRRSGLLGLSGVSSDLRMLRATESPAATLAIAIFCRSVAKQIAGMLAVLGGADLIVFTGGIGEHDEAARAFICADLAFAGSVPTAVMPSQEGARIARHVHEVTVR
ncbi:MAG: acetate kinase [Sphingomonas bacterium]|uniref:acetate/propionate family kinase n=1 Tax=Sphingomonas bacterium TaxID=1895847 RepID=UPI002614E3F3|nr:acetate kinase [Sphingomonas bacterium]MDB5696114.1 acetate kinase [Sphingomonas bacterium]